MQQENSKPRKYKSALKQITDDLIKYHLSVQDLIKYVFSNKTEKPALMQLFLEEFPPLLQFLSKQPELKTQLIEFCHNQMVPYYQSELEDIMAKKDIFRMPLHKATSSQILAFSPEAMADSMKSSAERLWDLLGNLLESNKRQRLNRTRTQRKLQDLMEVEGEVMLESETNNSDTETDTDTDELQSRDDDNDYSTAQKGRKDTIPRI